MSSAFVDEDSDHLEALPDIPQSHFPGYITPSGLERLQDELDRLENVERPPLSETFEAGESGAREAEVELARIDQRLRYLKARIARALIVDPSTTPNDHVHFGSVVSVRDQQGNEMRVRIVGEDETDPEHGEVSWVSPLAKALMKRHVGEKAIWSRPIGNLELTVLSID